MIPQRIKLQGFLSYQEEQEVSFDGASLWMLAGMNGSGKSSVFDAVTYALFGHHRNGSRDAQDLINKHSDRAIVEFDFSLDGQRYQAHRTIQRTKQGTTRNTQQMYRCLSDGTREAVPGTNLRDGFNDWVRDNIGLTYDTFTSSVLLLQGKADKLLDSTARGRFEVLAGIVDLERYKRLHEKADGQRKKLKDHAEVLKNQLAGLEEVSPLELAAADNRIQTAEEARQQAKSEEQRLQALAFQAGEWTRLHGRLTEVRRDWQRLSGLIQDADEIERDATRLAELREVLPHVETVITQRARLKEQEQSIARLASELQVLGDKISDCEQAGKRARQRQESLKGSRAADQQSLHDVEEQRRKLAAVLSRAEECERQRQLLARQQAELAKLPANPLEAQQQAQQDCERIDEVSKALPHLDRLRAQREGLHKERTRIAELISTEQEIKARGEGMKAEQETLKQQLQAAEQARQQADEQATEARMLSQQAQKDWQDLARLDGTAVCKLCGQQLTRAHLEQEQARREAARGATAARYREASAVQQASQKEEQQLRARFTELDQRLQAAREEYSDCRRQADQARKDAERFVQECSLAYRNLSDAFRSRVSPGLPEDWLTTTYPSPEDLEAARKQAKGLDAARRRLHDAQQTLSQWTTLQDRLATTRQNLSTLERELPSDLPALRQADVRLEAEQAVLKSRLDALQKELDTAQEEQDRLAQDRDHLQKQRAEREAKLQAEKARQTHVQQDLAKAQLALSPTWRADAERAGLAEQHRWRSELKALDERGTETRARDLQQARADLRPLEQAKADLEAEQEKHPAEARRDPAEVQTLLKAAQRHYANCDDEYQKARQEKVLLEKQHQDREQLSQQVLQVDGEFNLYKRLADLLGRDRLQLHLVRRAERQIVDQANTVLDRLSGGQLFLRLVGSNDGDAGSDQALELEAYNKDAGEAPINVAFLSGSQRFRVAVSLALGIGQYASRQHRPIESVIIDEGFGCLDRQGRQVMIQEMQALRDQLRCILLVSHQEEFADAFADGYHFELQEGSTRVRRFQR